MKASVVGMAWLLPMAASAVITSDFDAAGYPGQAGRGWSAGWSHTGDQAPTIESADPLEGESSYLHVDFSGTPGGYRNVLRPYESGGGVDITQTHRIQWKFRLDEGESDFESNFTTFDDRVHFFARNEPRAAGGTDSSMSWGIFAVGEAHSSGTGAGQTFWIYDNATGDSGFSPENAVDTGLALQPGTVYTFEVAVNGANQLYNVSITNESTGESFTTAAAHVFRDLSASATSHTILHFGVRADSNEVRAFDLDSLSIDQAVGAVPIPPRIENLAPPPYGVVKAEAGLRFEAVSETPIGADNISVTLNGEDVSDRLAISGEETHRQVAFNDLMAEQDYTAEITVTSEGGTATRTVPFSTVEEAEVVFESGGFEDDGIYPTGPLGSVTHGESEWQPSGEPAEIVDLADGEHGKVLRRAQTGDPNTDVLDFPQSGSGVLAIEFDARVSVADQRTLDMMLLPETGGNMASLLGWGINPGKLSYFDGSAWVAVADIDTEWHHFEVINFLSGPLAETFNLRMDGEIVARGLTWRHSFPEDATFGRLRIGGIRGPEGEFADLDNLSVEVRPEPPPPPQISEVTPAHRTQFHAASEGLSFQATSEEAIPEDGISVTVNGNDVSGELEISDEPTQRTVIWNNLEPNTIYEARIEVSNALGIGSATVQFDTIAESTTVFDVGGFEEESIYPTGPLGQVTDGIGTWTGGRTGIPADVVESDDPERGKVLRRAQTGEESVDILDFTPFQSGILTIAFDARVSTTDSRTLDMALNRTGQTQRASFLAWGEVAGELAYFDGEQWTGFAELSSGWHHYELIHRLDGADAHTFDVRIDGELVGETLPWNMGFDPDTPFGRLRIGAVNGVEGEYGEIDNLSITMTPPAPAITGLSPQPQATFHSAEEGISLTVQSSQAIAEDAVEILLNGEDITSQLEIGGEPTARTVSFDGLSPNRLYEVEVRVSNALGTTEQRFSFDTFSAAEATMIEVEDYNYQEGEFQDDPPPSGFADDGSMINGNGEGYLDLEGIPGIDYSVTQTPSGDPQESYRFLDSVNTRPTDDFLRDKYIETGAPDYEVWSVTAGDWMNYTRTFEGGPYQVYLRAAGSAAQAVRLDRVTSDRTEADQTTSTVGTFEVPNTEGDYRYVALTDEGGETVTVNADGVETFRLTSEDAEQELRMNYILFVSVSQGPASVVLLDPSMTESGFEFSIQTQAGASYTIEYTGALGSEGWSELESFSGDGSLRQVTDTEIEGEQRYYRARID